MDMTENGETIPGIDEGRHLHLEETIGIGMNLPIGEGRTREVMIEGDDVFQSQPSLS
jgi:hypothetical protein